MPEKIKSWVESPVSIAPLVTFRVIMGAILLFSTVRFMWLGWVDDHYLHPTFHFKYYGFEWVQPLSAFGMYAVHIAMIISSLCVVLGLFYRWAAIAQFVLFTYTELIDLSYYLNHYYFVSVACLLLIFVPANRAYALDVWRNPAISRSQTPRWAILIFQIQLALVYIYAGIWKISYDWLILALPLKIWVPSNDHLPVIGSLLRLWWVPYLFSWVGMLYDLTIVGWLCWKKTRVWAYLTVLVFHTLTGLLFQIGVFPLVMSGATLIFFSEKWHLRIWDYWERFCREKHIFYTKGKPVQQPATTSQWTYAFLMVFMGFQVVFPWRFLCYPGNVCWTEEGFRYSWRVMLMEKTGTATFFVKDAVTGREGEVVNSKFLNPQQEKQMATQPDMILQFAHYLKDYYARNGMRNPSVRAEVYVTLNGRPGKLFIDPNVDLTQLSDTWAHKQWIME